MRKLTIRQQVLYQLGLAAIGLFALLPIWGMARVALDGGIRGAPTEFRLWPEQFTFSVFRYVWEHPSQTLSIPGLFRNSLVVAGGAALLSVLFGASMAYAFARFRFPGRKAGLFALFLGALLPPVALMTPLYILLSEIGLRTSLFGLMIVYTAFSMPFCIWNMRASFQAVPLEIEESAYLDGASSWITFRRITLPLALPSIAVAALLAFMLGYTEFAIGWLFVESSENVTMAMAVSGMMRQSGVEWSNLSALALLMSIPVVVIFMFLYRYLMRGLLTGAADS
ncbi:MAG: carbohydrate ABC transporter permease [Anaerolineales bacterium]